MPDIKSKSRTPHYRVDNPNANNGVVEELEPVTKFVLDCWETWDSFWADKFNKFEEYYKQWKNRPPQRDEEWQAQFQKRLSWQAVATLVARYHSILFPVSAPVEAEATETQDEGYRILAKSIVSHWFKLGKVTKEFLSGMRSAGIYGTGLYEDDWFVRTALVAEKKEKQIPDFRALVNEQGNKLLDAEGNIRSEQIGFKTILSEEKKRKIVEDRYRVRKTSIFSWRIHPYKKDDDDDYPVIKQEFITYNDLVLFEKRLRSAGVSRFENMDKIEKDRFAIDQASYNRIKTDSGFKDKNNPLLEILIYWGFYEDKDSTGEEQNPQAEKKPRWIGIVNRKYKLWEADNPFWHQKSPLTHIVWTEDEQESYYGIGVVEIGKDAEDRANSNVNIRIDERKKNSRGGGWYNANDKKIKRADLQRNVPGLWKACSDVNASVKPDLPIPKSTLDDYKEEETAVNDHREITGATTSILPTADINQQHKTLGGMELLASQGLQRLKPDLSMMEIMGIRRLANRAFLMTRQFMTLPQTIELIASEDQLKQFNLSRIYKMEPNQLIGGVNFFCTGLSESIDKIQSIDKALKFMEVLQKTSPGNPFIFYLTKKIALWLGFEDADKFLQDNQMPMMAQPGQPGMPGGQQIPPQTQGLPPQILQMIMQRMQGMQQGAGQQQPVNQAGII